MNQSDSDTRALLVRAAAFGRENAQLFLPAKAGGKETKGQQLFTALDGVIEGFNEAQVRQSTSRGREATASKSSVRKALRKQIRGLHQAVGFIALERSTPELGERFGAVDTSNDEGLLAQATSFAEAIEELGLEADLALLEQGADVLEKLRERIAALRGHSQTQSGIRHQRSTATASIAGLRARGRMILKGLNAIIVKKLEDDDSMRLTAWKNAIRLPRRKRKASEKTPESEPASAGSTEAAPAAEPAASLHSEPEPASNGARGVTE